MFFSCFMCKRIKFGKYEEVAYTALDDNETPQQYTKKICPSCGDDIEKHGHLNDQIKESDDTTTEED